MSGTETAYGATSWLMLRDKLFRIGAYAATQCLRMPLPEGMPEPENSSQVCPIPLRACYAMSGTDLAYGFHFSYECFAITLRACCAMSSTDLAYAAMRCAASEMGMLSEDSGLLSPYAITLPVPCYMISATSYEYRAA
eukprot:3343033-Rhodomonas_salina.3